MEPSVELIIAILTSIFASSGFWLFIQRMTEKKDTRNKIILGLAHDRIIDLGLKYLDRGWITEDEYENLVVYLYEPYKKWGGNGTAKHIIEDRISKIKVVRNYEEGIKFSESKHD